MTWDIMTSLALIASITAMWVQRKTILQLERDIWEVEKSYKEVTGKPYQYIGRQFHLWGKNGGKGKTE